MDGQEFAVPTTPTIIEQWNDAPTDLVEVPDEVAERAIDALSGEHDREVDSAPDETEGIARSRMRAEAYEVKLRARLGDPKRARGVYHDLALLDEELTHVQFRVLALHLLKADPDLSNSFIGRAAAAKALGMEPKTYDKHVAVLRQLGYERIQEFRREDGTQARGTGVQFCLPGRLFQSERDWVGPRRWDKRSSGVPKRARKRTTVPH